MKKVLGIISSPRKKGNSEIITKEIMSHTGNDNQFEMLRLLDLNIEPCKACYSCMKPGRKCPRDDDMDFFLQKIAEADGIILSSPVYNWGISVGIRRIFDRAFLFREWRDRFSSKPCVTFVTYGIPFEEGYALNVLNSFARQLNLQLKDTAAFLGASPGDVLKNERNIERAKRLGKALFDPSYKRESSGFECPNCFSNMFKLRSEIDHLGIGMRPVGQVECAFCGAVAEIRNSENGLEVSFHGKGIYHEEFRHRLSQWHEKTIKSYIEERKDIERWIGKYEKMDIKIVSRYTNP